MIGHYEPTFPKRHRNSTDRPTLISKRSKNQGDLDAKLPRRSEFGPQGIVVGASSEIDRQLATDLDDSTDRPPNRKRPGLLSAAGQLAVMTGALPTYGHAGAGGPFCSILPFIAAMPTPSLSTCPRGETP
jgi:hypothetical protein